MAFRNYQLKLNLDEFKKQLAENMELPQEIDHLKSYEIPIEKVHPMAALRTAVSI